MKLLNSTWWDIVPNRSILVDRNYKTEDDNIAIFLGPDNLYYHVSLWDDIVIEISKQKPEGI